MSSRQRNVTVLGCAVSAGVALFTVSRTWQVELVHRVAPLPTTVNVHSGGDLVPALPALALVALAGAGGLLATRGTGRRMVAAVVALAGLLLAGLSAANLALGGVGTTWAALTILAGLGVATAGVVAQLRSGSWPALGRRYDRPAPADAEASRADERMGRSGRPASGDEPDGARASQAMWDAIERGEDPTSSR